ncbi:MAG: TfoX/Sxy family protein [candidate division Zixibacteria bacterium]|nr:TfoX/Sxy family protein [candidate division Zixibacteria bacterium]
MAYDEKLAERMRQALAGKRKITEKQMFGGLAFLADGKMFAGIIKTELMARVGPERYDDALKEPHVRPMDFTGRPMAGYVFVAPKGCRTSDTLERWIQWSLDYVSCLPAKPTKKAKAKGKQASK